MSKRRESEPKLALPRKTRIAIDSENSYKFARMCDVNSKSSNLADFEKLNVCFIMPNLRIKSPIESNFVGILPDTDARVVGIAKRDAAVYALINGFSDRWGTSQRVSVMVVHKDAPKRIMDISALVSFRNIFAICRILQSWQFSIGSPNAVGTRFSDYFDFYPFRPTRDGKDLLHMGFALNSFDTPDNFRAQIYPDLPSVEDDLHYAYDENLFEFLMKAWVDRFEKGRRSWPSNKLFRSLAIAYHASALPKKNGLWFYDIGVSALLFFATLIGSIKGIPKSDLRKEFCPVSIRNVILQRAAWKWRLSAF